MAESVHAFVRGSTARFYEWMDGLPGAASIPVGPQIWICGDCHLGNLGPLADQDGRVKFQLRDLDQTVIGNPALDIIRLALSLETAARSSDLPGVATLRIVEALSAGYVAALDADPHPPQPTAVRTVRRRAAARRWRHLADERIEGPDPAIPLGKRFWPISEEERKAIFDVFVEETVSHQVQRLADVGSAGDIRIIDAAYWKKGCSSLGRLRYCVLLGVRRTLDQEFLALVDVKEASRPLAPVADGVAMPRSNAERVVAGARALAPNLGERMIPAALLGKSVVLRELKPQDLKLELTQFSRKQSTRAAAYLGFVVGHAHARQTDVGGRKALNIMMRSGWGKTMAAPAWLWRSVVDLAAFHEGAYLDHCRRYARGD